LSTREIRRRAAAARDAVLDRQTGPRDTLVVPRLDDDAGGRDERVDPRPRTVRSQVEGHPVSPPELAGARVGAADRCERASAAACLRLGRAGLQRGAPDLAV